MPDWSYQTLFRPLLFRLPAARARDVTLRAMGTLARCTGRVPIIELFGDMHPPTGAGRSVLGIQFPSMVGLGAGLDIHGIALPALAQCGIGFLEAGPVTLAPLPESTIERRECEGAITYAAPLANDGAEAWETRLAQCAPLPVPLGVRLAYQPDASPAAAAHECGALAARLARYAAYFTLETRAGADACWDHDAWSVYLANATAAIHAAAPDVPLLLCLPPDCGDGILAEILPLADRHGVAGIVVGGGVATAAGGRVVGAETLIESLQVIGAIRARWGERFPIIGSGGIREPADALAMLAAGATLVQVHSGLVYTGPGLAKRIAAAVTAPTPAPRLAIRTTLSFRDLGRGWPWIGMMGLGILIAGIIAWIVAATRVVLPYDEAFLGVRRGDLAVANDRLLLFMTHDRITFAGAMITLGIVYAQYALFPLRNGSTWARRAVIASAGLGFCGFFLFLGFRYLDPLHAITTAPLFVFFLLGLLLPSPAAARPVSAVKDMHNDRRWRIGLWGQTLFVMLGFGFFLAGFTIAIVGITTLFVPTDLAFMHTTADTLGAINPRLIPLLAHDRASFGGTLVAVGISWTLGAMWGFQRGARWLWWTFLASGVPGFVTAVGVHLAVGYTAFEHLAPVYLAIVVYALALVLSYPYLCAPGMASSAPAPEFATSEPALVTERNPAH